MRGIIRQRIVNALAEAADGLHRDQLMNTVYYDDPNGGPAFATLRVNIWQTNKVLAGMGYRIKADNGRGSRYRLEWLAPKAPHRRSTAGAEGPRLDTADAGWYSMWAEPFDRPELIAGNGR